MNAWARPNLKQAASWTEQVYKKVGDGLKPNVKTYNTVINPLAKNSHEWSIDIKPDSYTDNHVINACTFTKEWAENKEALRITFNVFK